jgi:hypothetical protein
MPKTATIAVITSMMGDGKVAPGVCLAFTLNMIAVCTTASFTSTSQIGGKTQQRTFAETSNDTKF